MTGAFLLAGTVAVGATACQPPTTPAPDPGGATTTTTTASTSTSTTVAASTTSTTVAASSGIPVRAGYRYVGGDEFDGTRLDSTRWRAYANTYGDSNLEVACLTPANVTVGGGSLRIDARRETVACPGGTTEDYTSGFIGSREAGRYYPQFGRFEVRARLPHAQGLWPAFWLRHRNGAGTAEVDIMEYFHSQVPGRTTQTLHLDGVSNVAKRTTSFEAPTAQGGWHTWGVDIAPDPGGIRFTFDQDGVTTFSYVDAVHRWSAADPQATWDIAVNVAVGGRWVGRPDDALGFLRDLNRCSIGGTPPDRCASTGIRRVDWSDAHADVDYVRVYARS